MAQCKVRILRNVVERKMGGVRKGYLKRTVPAPGKPVSQGRSHTRSNAGPPRKGQNLSQRNAITVHPYYFSTIYLETESCCVALDLNSLEHIHCIAHTGLKLKAILLLYSPKWWHYRHPLLCLAEKWISKYFLIKGFRVHGILSATPVSAGCNLE